MNITESAKGVATALRLDSHHTIERFGVLFAATVLSFVLIFSGAAVSASSNQAAQLDSTVVYTPTFTTSKTQLTGDVSGVYTSTDGRRALVLMRFQNPSSVSANAKNYQAFLTGSDVSTKPEALKSTPTGEVVVFGSTGYLGVVLDSPEPFAQQILNLTVRANSELVYLPGEARRIREDLKGQNSFAEFDQWRIYFNPGASGVTTTTALDTKQFDPGAVYAQLVVTPEEEVLEKKLDDQLGQMQADQARIAEYESEILRVQVDNLYLTPPAVPEAIAGDKVSGTAAAGENLSTLKLSTDWVSPKGFDLDWREGSVEQGYLDDIVPAGESYVTFLAEKAAATSESATSTLRIEDEEWTLSNGALLSDYNSSEKSMKPLFDLRNNLLQAYEDYYRHKTEHQVTSQGSLIDLEVDLRNVRSGASVNSDAKALFTY